MKKNLKTLTQAHVKGAISKMESAHQGKLGHFQAMRQAAKHRSLHAAVDRAQERAQRNFERARAAMHHRLSKTA